MACLNQIQKENLIAPMKMAIGFQEVAQFIQANKGTPCRMTCAICRENWKATKTMYVNVLTVQRYFFYICDGCTGIPELSEAQKVNNENT